MENGLLFQAFEWYLNDDGNYYNDLINKLDELKSIGVTAIWLPPVHKATGTNDVGYGVYDLFDLGEFDQKGSIRTKYGTKEELMHLIEAIHNRDIKVYADVVINHKAGADRDEKFMAVMVDSEDRNKEIGEPLEIQGFTGFDFLGRKDKYSSFKWNFNHFSGIDYDNATGTTAIYKILGENKGWNLGVSHEKGNFDYLMFANIDHAHPDVKRELNDWAIWFINTLSLDGFRLDAVKHIDATFMDEFLNRIRDIKGKDFYFMGEYWLNDVAKTTDYLERTNYKTDLFDVSLHFNLSIASKSGQNYDLRTIFDNTITQAHPSLSVTFVDNHDSQPGQALESYVEHWFKEIAYGLIFLRQDGYPCLFYGDYYGISGDNPQPSFKENIDKIARIRKQLTYGDQDDYFEQEHCIGWVRHGNDAHPNKCAVVISNGEPNTLRMFVGIDQASRVYVDYMGNNEGTVTIDDDGYGDFMVSGGSISAWADENFYFIND